MGADQTGMGMGGEETDAGVGWRRDGSEQTSAFQQPDEGRGCGMLVNKSLPQCQTTCPQSPVAIGFQGRGCSGVQHPSQSPTFALY